MHGTLNAFLGGFAKMHWGCQLQHNPHHGKLLLPCLMTIASVFQLAMALLTEPPGAREQLDHRVGSPLFFMLGAGTLPESWGQLAALKWLTVEANNLRGTLPASWGAGMRSLGTLSLRYNFLAGEQAAPHWQCHELTNI